MSNKQNTFQLLSLLKNKYCYTTLGFLIWIAFIDESNFVKQYQRTQELNTILAKKQFNQAEISRLRKQIELLEQDDAFVEKLAREQYKMKKDNEDIFVFEKSSK